MKATRVAASVKAAQKAQGFPAMQFLPAVAPRENAQRLNEGMPRMKPAPQIAERRIDRCTEHAALSQGYTPLQARIIAARLPAGTTDVRRVISPPASAIDSPETLPDIDVAARVLADAVEQRRHAVLLVDFDADGAAAAMIIRSCLLDMGHPADRVRVVQSHRTREGYGISDALLDRVIDQLPPGALCLTADQGTCDEERIARLARAGHLTVVSDHHGVPDEGPPPSAIACVNPMRQDSRFPDRTIAGCYTAMLVMAATREALIARGVLDASAPRVSRHMDAALIGTVADCVSLASINNRAVVQRGLYAINTQPRPCWQAMRQLLGKTDPWTTEDVAFRLSPMINASSRVGDACLAISFLTATSVEAALPFAAQLIAVNEERKGVEKRVRDHAMVLAAAAVADGRHGLCLWLGDHGRSGVHGISATRVVEAFGRPTICLSPVEGDDASATGSIRTTEDVHVREVLTRIQRECPGLLRKAGGHRGAGGCAVARADIPKLVEAWDVFVREALGGREPAPSVLTDGGLPRSPDFEMLAEMAALAPYGRGFPAPVFSEQFRVMDVAGMGDGTHLRLRLRDSRGQLQAAVWFGAKDADAPSPVAPSQTIEAAFEVASNTFRGASSLQLRIIAARALPAAAPGSAPGA